MKKNFILPIIFVFFVCFANAALVSFEDFETGATGWNNNTTDSSNTTNFTRFLGRFAGTSSAQGYYKTYALDGLLNKITIQFDFYRIDSWDSEKFFVFIDDVVVSEMTYIGSTPSTLPYYIEALTPVQEMGWASNSGWREQKLRYTLLVNTQASSIKLGFGSNLSSGIADESWGIDNVMISSQYIPELSVVYLFSLSILFVGFLARKKVS